MKNKLLAIVLAVVMLFGMAISTSAGLKLDAPQPGGDHIFGPERMMYYEEGTKWHNGIVNGAVPHPTIPGTFSTWQGIKFLPDTYKASPALRLNFARIR